VEVHIQDDSAMTQLLDLAYDPVSITFLLLDSRRQMRLMCLVGELVSDRDWNQLGVVRSEAYKSVRGLGQAGAPFDFEQFAQDIHALPSDGRISKNVVGNATGAGTETDNRRTEKRLQRAKARLKRVREQVSI